MLSTRPSAPSWSSRPSLVLLAQFTALAVKHGPRHIVTAFSTVGLNQRVTALGLVIDVGQRMQRLVNASEFGDRLRQAGSFVADLQGAHDAGGRHAAKFERTGQAQHVTPVRRNALQAELIGRDAVEKAVIGLGIDPPKTCSADIGQTPTQPIRSHAPCAVACRQAGDDLPRSQLLQLPIGLAGSHPATPSRHLFAYSGISR